MKTLYIIKGLPGAGKTTLGNKITPFCYAADDYFDYFCNGEFRKANLKEAHLLCQLTVETQLALGRENVAVTNTFTQAWEVKPYLDLAQKYGYTVHQIIVENTHGNKSVHNVPEQTIEKMRKRFEINL